MLTHMHDLRMWVMAYAPTKTGGMERMQEIHYINNEMTYRIYRSAWKKLVFIPLIWFLVFKVFKKRFMNFGLKDSVEMSWRDTHQLN